MKIRYNSPVILTYALVSIAVLILMNLGVSRIYFSSPPALSFSEPLFHVRLLSYITGHADWTHLVGNLMLILLVGPLLEEKYGPWKLFEMFCVTAVATALLNAIFFSNSLMGGSGIAFMLILLGSFANFRARQIPLTFVIIAILFIGSEVTAILKVDRISQFSHLAGGFMGASYGFFRGGRH